MSLVSLEYEELKLIEQALEQHKLNQPEDKLAEVEGVLKRVRKERQGIGIDRSLARQDRFYRDQTKPEQDSTTTREQPCQ